MSAPPSYTFCEFFVGLVRHLLIVCSWNSVILTSPASFEYIQLTVTTKFLTDASSYNATQGLEILNTGIDGSLYPDNLDIVRNSLNDTDVWEHLDKADCTWLRPKQIPVARFEPGLAQKLCSRSVLMLCQYIRYCGLCSAISQKAQRCCRCR